MPLRKPSSPSTSVPRVNLNVTSDPANLAPVRQSFEQFAIECGFDARAVGDIGLCINEAMANVTRHAYHGATDRPIEVAAEYANGALRITLRDWGTGENPAARLPAGHDPARPGGLGLICMRSLMDQVIYEPQPDGMRLTLIKKRAAG